jgi:hypothetical protein
MQPQRSTKAIETEQGPAVPIDAATLASLGIGPETELRITVDGGAITITPAVAGHELRRALEDVNDEFSDDLKRLGE